MRWLAALGWAAAGGIVVVRYLLQGSVDSRGLYIGLFFVLLAALIGIGRRVGRVAAGYGTGVATLAAVGSLLLIGMVGSGALLITLYMAPLAFVSYRAATNKP